MLADLQEKLRAALETIEDRNAEVSRLEGCVSDLQDELNFACDELLQSKQRCEELSMFSEDLRVQLQQRDSLIADLKQGHFIFFGTFLGVLFCRIGS